MVFLVIGVLLILCNLAGIGPMAEWNFNLLGDLWKFCLPFVLAAVWWAWADASGLNKRREMEKMEAKRRDRREANMVSLGMDRDARRRRRKAGGR